MEERRSNNETGVISNNNPVLPTTETQNRANHLEELLQGLRRVARVAMETKQMRPHEVDPFFEMYRSFISLNPPTFDDTDDFLGAENWLANVKEKFQILRAPDEYRVELAAQLLEGHARFWWQEVKRRWDETGRPVSWAKFQNYFEGRYMDVISREVMRQQFTNLRQENSLVTEYNSKFENLMRYAPDIIRDEFRVRQQYLGGLNPRLAQLIDIPGIDKLPDLMLRATIAESYETRVNQLIGVRNTRPRMEETPRSHPIMGNDMEPRSNVRPNEKPWCNRCHKPHTKEQCSFANGLCHKCLMPGHFARECPNKPPQSNMVLNEDMIQGTMRPPTIDMSDNTMISPIGRRINYNNSNKGRNMGQGRRRVGVYVHSSHCNHIRVEEGAELTHKKMRSRLGI